MNDEIPTQLRNALEMRGLVAIPKKRYEYLIYREHHADFYTGAWRSPSFRYAFKNLFESLRWSNLRIELNPAVHVRRRRYRKHVDEHGCGKPGGGGIAYCEEAMRLWDPLPDKNKVVIG